MHCHCHCHFLYSVYSSPTVYHSSSCKLRLHEIPSENTVEFAHRFFALQTQTSEHTIIWTEFQKDSSLYKDDDSYMCWKLLEFLRVSSLDPDFDPNFDPVPRSGHRSAPPGARTHERLVSSDQFSESLVASARGPARATRARSSKYPDPA